ncbi:Small subunit (SSU) processome component [Blastocladiella emersonii ATCC 22665]|nr:Small subunit (SSU) processome component [Blastocladiella emersonii ATCC 22665]
MQPTASATGSARYAYSADTAYLAVVQEIADAQRVSLWKTATAAVLADHTPPDHTTVTSVAWGTLPAGGNAVMPVLAICLSNGTVQIVSALDGNLHATLAGAHSSAVNAFVFVPGSATAYSCGQDDWIVKWDVAKGTVETKFKSKNKASPKQLLLTPDGKRLIVADSGITIFDLAKQHAVVAKFSAHTSDVTHLATTRDGRLLLTSASQDRFVNVYDISLAQPQPLPALSLDHNVRAFAVSHADATPGAVAVLSENGTLGLWASAAPAASPAPGGKKNKRAKFSARAPESVLRVVSLESKEDVPVTAAAFTTTAAAESRLLVTRGASLNPVFETLAFTQADGSLVESATLVRSTQIASFNAKPNAGKRQEYRTGGNSTASHASDMALPTIALKPASGAAAEEQQKSLAERLAALQMNTAAATAAAAATATSANGTTAAIGDITSLHVTLTQALHSGDTDLLESVLGAPSLTPQVIQNTLRKLPTQHVVPFLHAVVDRFMRRHSRAAQLLEWIRAAVVVHCGYLMTVPDLVRKLSAFYHVLDTRVDHGKKLLKLQGRLELVLDQLEQRHDLAGSFAAAATSGGRDASVLVVNDDDNDGEDYFEDMRYAAARGGNNTLRHVKARANSRTLEQLGDELNSSDHVDGAVYDEDDDDEEYDSDAMAVDDGDVVMGDEDESDSDDDEDAESDAGLEGLSDDE